MAEIKIGIYPYTYVRTTVMKSLLFSRQDYDKILKMSLPEITKYMQDSNYKKEIDELALDLSGVDLIEHSLNKSLLNSYQKLRRISPDEVDILIDAYLRKNHYHNIIQVNSSRDEFYRYYLPYRFFRR